MAVVYLISAITLFSIAIGISKNASKQRKLERERAALDKEKKS